MQAACVGVEADLDGQGDRVDGTLHLQSGLFEDAAQRPHVQHLAMRHHPVEGCLRDPRKVRAAPGGQLLEVVNQHVEVFWRDLLQRPQKQQLGPGPAGQGSRVVQRGKEDGDLGGQGHHGGQLERHSVLVVLAVR